MRRFLLPLLLMLLFVSESIFVELFPFALFGSNHIIVPRFLMVALLFLTAYGSKKYGIIYGFLFGLLFDIVYTEIIGIYLFLFPLVIYISSKLLKILQTNIVMVSFVAIIGVMLLELGAYEMNFLIHRTHMDFSSYLSLRLLPTSLLNVIFIIVASLPLKKHLEKFAIDLDD
ncbi:rod shape-determining protein MreD [Bacillus sp. FJAT-29790]|uniref:rod shape-determining protein MreD n=1 Tax=Bacillus sp. FJAT-29790 TaxID=1895002 RepID=UPI001C228B8D|nr:rod shape-determining protein MreD [Bacillus sp. FJAT-29790]